MVGREHSGIILIDGSDCAGKTTLAQAIAARYTATIIHQVYRWKDRMFTYHTGAMRRAMKKVNEGKLVILDRHWPSELIYGKVYRGGSPFPQEGRFMDRLLLKQAALTILCVGDPAVIESRHAEMSKVRHEDYTDGMRKVAQAFLDITTGADISAPRDYAEFLTATRSYTRPDQLKYDIAVEGRDIQGFAGTVMEKLALWQNEQFSPALDPLNQNILGHLATAKYLFVGDQCNVKHRWMHWPFYEYANCSEFMSQCLHTIGFHEADAMWTNISAPMGAGEQIVELLECKKLKVIALGKEASRHLDEIGIQHRTISHPQHGRRFRRHDYPGHLKAVLAGDDI